MKAVAKFYLSLVLAAIITIFIIWIILPAMASTFQSNIFDNTLGFKTQGYYDPRNDTITILINQSDPEYKIVLKHELCHQRQHREGKLTNSTVNLFIREIECYIKQYY